MKKIFNKTGLLILIMVTVASLGVSYAAYTTSLEAGADLTTGNLDFEFSQSDELVSIEVQKGFNGNPQELKADVDYDGKTLRITNIEAIDVSLLEKGNLRFIIRYGIKPSDNSSLLNAIIKEKNDGTDQYISLRRNSTTPQWIIKDGCDDWSFDSMAAGVASQSIYGILPDSLGEFQVTQSLGIARNEEYFEGIIILEQKDVPDWISPGPILLSQLELPAEIVEKMVVKEDLTLSLFGFYSFEIPLALDQFNAE